MGTAGTSRHYDDKREIQVIEVMSMRVSMHSTGTELLVVVMKRL